MKSAFIDVGELGWSLYLSAHMRWLKRQGHSASLAMTLHGRECLYEGLANPIVQVPDDFYTYFNAKSQNCFTLYGVRGKTLKKYFNSRLPEGYYVSEIQPFDCHRWNQVFVGQMLFETYPCREKLKGTKEILILSRHRDGRVFKLRNLPKIFYVKLIDRLCDEFKDCVIRALGTRIGVYNITEIKKPNYINSIGETPTIQALIDRYQVAVGAVGSQSFPPKLALLQGVSTFMIGHEKERHTRTENWKATKVGFYKVSNYANFNFAQCINQAVTFMRGCV